MVTSQLALGDHRHQWRGRLFPLAPNELHGRSILLIAIPRGAETTAQILAGEAQWTGSELCVRYHPTRPAMRATGSPGALAGHDPATLPRFIVPDHLATVTALAATAQAWAVVFATGRVPDVPTLSMPFFGLAERADGAASLFEGSSDDGWIPDDENRPDGNEPWKSSEQVT